MSFRVGQPIIQQDLSKVDPREERVDAEEVEGGEKFGFVEQLHLLSGEQVRELVHCENLPLKVSQRDRAETHDGRVKLYPEQLNDDKAKDVERAHFRVASEGEDHRDACQG